MSYKLASKSPTDVLNYGLNWRNFLGVDSISSATIVLCPSDASGVTLTNKVVTAMTTSCAVNGGTVGETAQIEHTIISVAGLKRTEVISVPIVADCPA